MTEFQELKAEYVALAGKNLPPMSADALRSKVEELRAAVQPEAKAPAAAAPAAEQSPAEAPEAEKAEAEPEAPSSAPAADAQSVEDACAEHGLTIEDDGHCAVEMLDGVSGAINLSRGDPHRFEAAEAVRAVRAGIAKPRG